MKTRLVFGVMMMALIQCMRVGSSLAATSLPVATPSLQVVEERPVVTRSGPLQVHFHYYVKFVCGTVLLGSEVAPGTFVTAVNVLNTGDAIVAGKITYTATRTNGGGGVGAQNSVGALGHLLGFEIDCGDIGALFGEWNGLLIKGFLHIEAAERLVDAPLRVTTVYTAGPPPIFPIDSVPTGNPPQNP
jgi:hypothetical protein